MSDISMELAKNRWQEWPCRLVNVVDQGRHLVALKDLRCTEVVLVSEAYLTALIPSFKKRICRFCLIDHQRRLETSCRSCDQAWYCSAQCQQAHWSGQLPTANAKPAARAAAVTAHSRHLVPHSLTCAVLKRFSSIKCDPGMESVIRMCLDAMALQYLEGKPSHRAESSCTKSSPNLPDPDYKTNPQGLPQQLMHPLDGQQTPANQQAPHVSPIQPTDVASAHTSWQQLQRMRIHSSSQTCEQSSSETSQPHESAPPSSASSNAEPCVHTSHTPQTHPASTESVQTASSLCPGLSAETEDLPAPQLPDMTHAELTQLQSHAADFTDKDRRDWLINLRFLRASMQQAHWPGDICSEDALLDMVGRIASNNFGIYSTRQRRHPQQPQQPATPSKSCEPRAVPDQAASFQSQGSLSPDSTQRHSDELSASDQSQAMRHTVVEKQFLPCHVSFIAKGTSALQQTASPQAQAHSASAPREVLPWPLQADSDSHSHSPFSSSSEPAAAQGGTPQGSSPTAARPHQQQPFQLDSPALLCEEQRSSQVEFATRKCSKRPVQRLPAKERPAKEDVVGREMYITASFFNHSCEPNCIKRRLHGQQSGVATVTALRDIKAGEALTISYIDLELPRSARHLELKTCFFFDCKCVRCERELIEGSKKCSYAHNQTQRQDQAPKRRGTKARVSR